MLKYGFPLDFPDVARNALVSTEESYASATQYPTDIEHYLQEKVRNLAIAGPYKEPPFKKFTHISLFMSRPKPDSNHRRAIIDLSWPKQASVNHFTKDNIYLNSVFKLQYPTIDDITDTLKNMGKDALLYKIDLSGAFRQLPVDPYDYNLLCYKCKGQYFCDLAVPFGHKFGSNFCTKLTSFFRYLALQEGHISYTYIDDVIGTSLPDRRFKVINFFLSYFLI